MENSKINWTDHTWNPWIGCRHVSAECDHCYADTMVTNRMGRDFSVVQRTKTWKEPHKWNRKAPQLAAELSRRVRVFCASLTDFFIQDADEWRDEAWDVIRQCSEMDWLILTKRPQLIPRRLPADWGTGWPHVWLGTTCGVRSSYSRLDTLRSIPAEVRFISAEPLLESLADIDLTGFHWLIAGGESGSGFRPMKEEWAVELRDICAKSWVGFHFKQHSAFQPGHDAELCGRRYHEPPLVQIVQSAEKLQEQNRQGREHTQKGGQMKIVPLHLRQANELVAKWHRHHKPIKVAKFGIGAVDDNGELVGAAICMRPATQALDDGKTLEVCRLVTKDADDVRKSSVCSILYGACARVASEMGYEKIQTYILDEEPGTSLRGAGWKLEKTGCGGTPRATRRGKDVSDIWDATTLKTKQRWAKILDPKAVKARKPGWDEADIVQDERSIYLRLRY